VESSSGDDTRRWQPPTSADGESTYFLAANRNKRSIAIDLDQPAGVEVVHALAERADVVVESFRPGALDRRGLGYDAMAARNPALIWCSISAFGREGPLAGRPGYDPVLQARTGIMSMTGYPDSPPARLGIGAIDLGTGLWATVAIQAALAERARDGTGTRIDTSLYEVAVWWLSYHLEGYLASGQSPSRGGTSIGFIAPYEVFPTSDGIGVMVAAANDHLYANLCRALGLPDDPRFATNPDRVAHRADVCALVAERTRAYTAPQLEELLERHAVPCSRVRSVGETAEDEQTAVLGILANLPHPRIPDLRVIDMPVSEAGARADMRQPPPLLGEHTDAVLAELGYADDAVARLRKDGAVA